MTKVYDVVQTDKAPSAIGAYSQGVRLGDMFYFSGQIGMVPVTGEISSNFEEQLQQILVNIDGLLKSQNLSRDDIFKTTIFMKDLSDFPKVNEAYHNFFNQPFPARSCVEVSRLPKDSLIEIEVIASKR